MGSDEDAMVCTIVEDWLKTHGFDGIRCQYCSCFVEDGGLMHCDDGPVPSAEPCVRVRCGGSPECEGCTERNPGWRGGAGVPVDWCRVSRRRRDELLAGLGGDGR